MSEHIKATITIERDGQKTMVSAEGNGRFDAVSNALKDYLDTPYTDLIYKEHALEEGSTSQAAAYVGITMPDGRTVWGAGIHNDIIVASVTALVSAINRAL